MTVGVALLVTLRLTTTTNERKGQQKNLKQATHFLRVQSKMISAQLSDVIKT
jgi:hypothetical protein